MINTVFPMFLTQFILDQQAVAEHWDLPNTRDFPAYIDVASAEA
jgi:hypothetical protein